MLCCDAHNIKILAHIASDVWFLGRKLELSLVTFTRWEMIGMWITATVDVDNFFHVSNFISVVIVVRTTAKTTITGCGQTRLVHYVMHYVGVCCTMINVIITSPAVTGAQNSSAPHKCQWTFSIRIKRFQLVQPV